MSPIVWIVEIKENGKYRPCAEARLTRSEARWEIDNYWKSNYPYFIFRITKYRRVNP